MLLRSLETYTELPGSDSATFKAGRLGSTCCIYTEENVIPFRAGIAPGGEIRSAMFFQSVKLCPPA
jgi:hypothetical protein